MKTLISVLILLIFMAGCTSSSHLEQRAENHAKAGDYYESIGQPEAAKEAYQAVKKDKNDAWGIIPILVDLYEHLNKGN
jgi:hypothetical protein